MKKKILTTSETARAVADVPMPGTAWGLSSDEVKDHKVVLDDKAFILRFATAEDYKVLRGMIEARTAKRPAGWRVLPDGMRIPASAVLMLCTKCRTATWADPAHEGGYCLRCNVSRYQDGGKMRLATKAEEAAWMVREAKAIERWKRDAPKRQAEVDAANRRRFADTSVGGER